MITALSRYGASLAELLEHARAQAATTRHDSRLPGSTNELRARLCQRAKLWAARAAAIEMRMRAARETSVGLRARPRAYPDTSWPLGAAGRGDASARMSE